LDSPLVWAEVDLKAIVAGRVAGRSCGTYISLSCGTYIRVAGRTLVYKLTELRDVH